MQFRVGQTVRLKSRAACEALKPESMFWHTDWGQRSWYGQTVYICSADRRSGYLWYIVRSSKNGELSSSYPENFFQSEENVEDILCSIP